jgi:hypothetical protein
MALSLCAVTCHGEGNVKSSVGVMRPRATKITGYVSHILGAADFNVKRFCAL